MSRIGEKIKEVRIEKGITQKQLGKKIGVAENFINEVEIGRKVINENLLDKIAKVLGVDLDDVSVSFQAQAYEEEKTTKLAPKSQKNIRPTKPEGEVNELWSEAFSSVLKNVGIYKYDMAKSIGTREMPVKSNKIEGYAQDKVLFLEIEDDDMLGYRICKGDIAFAHLTHEVENNAICLVDYNGARVLRQVKRLDSSKALLLSNKGSLRTETVQIKELKVLAKLERVEIKL